VLITKIQEQLAEFKKTTDGDLTVSKNVFCLKSDNYAW